MSTSRSPGTPTASGSTRPSGWRSLTTTFFSVSAAVHSRSARRRSSRLLMQIDERLDGRRVGGVGHQRRGRASSYGSGGGTATRTASVLAA